MKQDTYSSRVALAGNQNAPLEVLEKLSSSEIQLHQSKLRIKRNWQNQ